MRFDPRFLDEIRTRLPISRVVGRSVQLKRQGREFTALSPFNKEKSPSFFVNDDKRFYHCFSSGKHGDVFTWVMEMEGLSFPEAVERLAGEAGVALPAQDPVQARVMAKRRALTDVMALAGRFFQDQLRKSQGQDARDYLARRGLDDDIIGQFELGYAPASRHALKQALLDHDVSQDDLVACGLVIQPDDGGASYDRFRDRVMFPIRDASGRMIAFGGRALAKTAKAKYLNSPETSLFHKGDTLYRFKDARAGLVEAERAASAAVKNAPRQIEPTGLVVCEGYMDVIALAQAGFATGVAPLGTALTENQLELLWQAGPEPIICFDGDGAGLRAAYRAMDRILPLVRPGRTAKFALLPAGQDPDDFIREQGPAAMAKVLDNAKPMNEMVWDRLVAENPADTPERKAGLRAAVINTCSKIEDEDVRQDYRMALLDRFYERFRRRSHDGAWQGGRGGGRGQAPRSGGRSPGWSPAWSGRSGPTFSPRATPETQAQKQALGARKRLRLSRQLLWSLLSRPDIIERCAEALAQLDVPDDTLAQLQNGLVQFAAKLADVDAPVLATTHEGVDSTMLDDHLCNLGLERVASGVLADPLAKTPISASTLSSVEAAQRWLHLASTLSSEGSREHERRDVVERFKAARRSGDVEEMRRAQRGLVSLKSATRLFDTDE